MIIRLRPPNFYQELALSDGSCFGGVKEPCDRSSPDTAAKSLSLDEATLSSDAAFQRQVTPVCNELLTHVRLSILAWHYSYSQYQPRHCLGWKIRSRLIYEFRNLVGDGMRSNIGRDKRESRFI